MSIDGVRPLVIAVATQQAARHFARATLLGRSLMAFPQSLRPTLSLWGDNRGEQAIGLPEIYNRAIDQAADDTVIAFVHDDVYIHDWNLAFSLSQALACFDVIGVVGSSQVPFGQQGWWHHLDSSGQPKRNDSVIRSGCINHFDPNLVRPDWYGPSPQGCDLLDGVFLAASVRCLRENAVRFDPQFRFHCYDSDFCYSARRNGLKLGTWPLSLTHGSGGSFDLNWIRAAQSLTRKLRPGEP